MAVKKLRTCIDPKDLKKALKCNHYNIKTIDDILPNLAKAKVFSVLDGYHQIELDNESSYLTTFWSPKGCLWWLWMSFGVTTASEEYHSKQEKISGLKGVETIHDNILILGYGETRQEALENHNKNLENLLKQCWEKNLKLNMKKVKFQMTEVKFMGQILSADGMKPDESKVTAIRNSQTLNSLISRMCKLSYRAFTKHFGHCETSTRFDMQQKKISETKQLLTVQPNLS